MFTAEQAFKAVDSVLRKIQVERDVHDELRNCLQYLYVKAKEAEDLALAKKELKENGGTDKCSDSK